MNAEIKAQWLAALRSGEYIQGRGALRKGHQMCCLGVLCNLAAKANIGHWQPHNDRADCYEFVEPDSRNSEYPPFAVVEWAGLTYDNPELTDEGRIGDYNDGTSGIDHPHTFTELADLIEKHL